MLEKYDIITLDDEKEYSAVELFSIDGIPHILCVEVSNDGTLNKNNKIVLKKADDDFIKIDNKEELSKIEETLKPYLDSINE